MLYQEMIDVCNNESLNALFVQENDYDPDTYCTLEGMREEEKYWQKYSDFKNIDFNSISDEELYELMVDGKRYKLIFVEDISLYYYRLENLRKAE